MAITVKCGACGNTAQAPDTAAGAKGKCRACGAVVEVPKAGTPPSGAPHAASSPKMCVACGVDVAGKKRTKDPRGNYFCQPCWDAKVREGKAVAVQAGVGAGVGGAGGAKGAD